jgi:hypothetical protein
MPMHPPRQGRAHECFSMAEAGHGLDPQRDQGAPRGKAARIPPEWSPVGRASVRLAIGHCTSRLLIGSASRPGRPGRDNRMRARQPLPDRRGLLRLVLCVGRRSSTSAATSTPGSTRGGQGSGLGRPRSGPLRHFGNDVKVWHPSTSAVAPTRPHWLAPRSGPRAAPEARHGRPSSWSRRRRG